MTNQLPRTGLTVSVLSDRGSRYDCTNGGISSRHDRLTLLGDGISGPFEPTEDAPAVALAYDLEPGPARAGYLMAAKPSWLRELAGLPAIVSEFACMSPDWSAQHRLVRVRAVPVIDGKPKTGGMFGGNYISTSDSRMPVHGPIPLFDRFE